MRNPPRLSRAVERNYEQEGSLPFSSRPLSSLFSFQIAPPLSRVSGSEDISIYKRWLVSYRQPMS